MKETYKMCCAGKNVRSALEHDLAYITIKMNEHKYLNTKDM